MTCPGFTWDTASGGSWGEGPSLVVTRLAQVPPLAASFLGVLCRDPHVGLTRRQAHSAVRAFRPSLPVSPPPLRPSGPSPRLGPHMVPSVGKVGWRSCWGFLRFSLLLPSSQKGLRLPVTSVTCAPGHLQLGSRQCWTCGRSLHFTGQSQRDGTFLPLGVTMSGGVAWTSSMCPVSWILHRERS